MIPRAGRGWTRRARAIAAAASLGLSLSGCAGTRPAGGGAGAEVAPATAEEWVARSDSAIALGQAETARRALDRAAALAPQDPAVALGYGRYYTATRRYRDAKAEFERAAALDPASPEPHYWLGVAYLNAGEPARAEAAFASALRLDPAHPPARSAIRPLLEARYAAAGVPREYATFAERPALTRGEVGVALAVELGADPGRPVWRSADAVTDWTSIDAAWGAAWLRSAVERGWIRAYPDGDFHLGDPVTRGALAILVSEIAARDARARAEGLAPAGGAPGAAFSDLGPRDYLVRPAEKAVGFGLPTREEGRFEPRALATGRETLLTLRGLGRSMGVAPLVSGEPR